MRWLLLIALFAALPAAGQEAEAEKDDRVWYCSRDTQTALGSVSVYRYVSREGEQQGGGTSWLLDTSPQAISVYGGWSAGFDRESGNQSILIDYGMLPANGRYRIEIRRPGPRGATLAKGELTAPEKGRIIFFTDVRVMADADHGSATLVLLVIDARGRIVRRDSFDAAAFRRLLPVLHDLQAPVEAMTANYSKACELVHPPQGPEPTVVMP